MTVATATFCSPGRKGGYDAPEWVLPLSLFAVLACAAIAALWTISHQKAQPKGWPFVLGLAAWTVVGALLGAMAWVWVGFEGYFVFQSNAGPIRCAAIGAIVGAAVALLWRLAVAQLYWKPPTPPAR